MSQRGRPDIVVWSACGGHGATTVAGVLAASWGCRFQTDDPVAYDWIFGELPKKPAGVWSLTDGGTFRSGARTADLNVVVLRGPCSVALRKLRPLRSAIDHLVLIREPWRRIADREVEVVLQQRIAVHIPFSERIPVLTDAGLLGFRLDHLQEFDGLRRWADAHPSAGGLAAIRKQMARRTG